MDLSLCQNMNLCPNMRLFLLNLLAWNKFTIPQSTLFSQLAFLGERQRQRSGLRH